MTHDVKFLIMKRTFILISFFIVLLAGENQLSLAQDIFKSAIDTKEKPWTNLDFYNNPDNFQFAIVTDRNGGNRPLIFEDAVKKLNIMYPEFVLSVGDLINGYTKDTAQIKTEWDEVNHIIDDLKMPFFYLPGNHDITNKVMAGEWEKRYGKRYYYFIYKNTLFLILDSNDDDDYNLTREQTDFVLETLKENANVRWTFLLMHHPIWTYNTNGRFEEIETALSGRKYTVIAGHTHHYSHEVKKGQNYYVLATTGGGSRLRGNYFGEFDHITWVTMTDAGPSMANLRLDGILPHDIINDETKSLANALAANAVFEHVILCNPGEKFTGGTLYFHFKNNGDESINMNYQFYHQHQLLIPEPHIKIKLAPGENKVIEFPFRTSKPMAYEDVEDIQIDWSMGYDLPEYPEFQLKGVLDLEVKPTAISFLEPKTPKFLNALKVTAENTYQNLKVSFEFNQKKIPEEEIINGNEIQIDKTGIVGIKLQNESGQSTNSESWSYEMITKLNKAKKLRNPENGLNFKYYEGTWEKMPDFDQLKPVTTGTAKDFWVGDYAKREDNFGLVFSGYIEVPEDGMYIFSSKADDACKLFIHDELLVSQGKVNDAKEIGAIALKKGFHPVKIWFMETTGRERLRIYMKKTYSKNWRELEVKNSFFR